MTEETTEPAAEPVVIEQNIYAKYKDNIAGVMRPLAKSYADSLAAPIAMIEKMMADIEEATGQLIPSDVRIDILAQGAAAGLTSIVCANASPDPVGRDLQKEVFYDVAGGVYSAYRNLCGRLDESIDPTTLPPVMLAFRQSDEMVSLTQPGVQGAKESEIRLGGDDIHRLAVGLMRVLARRAARLRETGHAPNPGPDGPAADPVATDPPRPDGDPGVPVAVDPPVAGTGDSGGAPVVGSDPG